MIEALFPKNMGIADRAIRIALGFGVLGLVFWGPQTMWGLAGFIFLWTGFSGSCPLYRPFGIKTCSPD